MVSAAVKLAQHGNLKTDPTGKFSGNKIEPEQELLNALGLQSVVLRDRGRNARDPAAPHISSFRRRLSRQDGWKSECGHDNTVDREVMEECIDIRCAAVEKKID